MTKNGNERNWKNVDDSKFAWRKLVADIRDLEQKYRQTNSGFVEDALIKLLDRFYEFALPPCLVWMNKTKFRHPQSKLTRVLEGIITSAKKAHETGSLNDKLISMESLINAHHTDNHFGQAVNELYDGKHPLLH